MGQKTKKRNGNIAKDQETKLDQEMKMEKKRQNMVKKKQNSNKE